jgi:hypothetical protein
MKTALFCLGLVPALAGAPALTLYHQGFAVVRERVPLRLAAGETETAFAGVTAQVEPDSVVLRDPAGKVAFRVLEQSYRADVVSQALLLTLHEGRELDFLVRDRDAREHTVRGRVIRGGHQPGGEPVAPIIEVEGKVRFSLPGEPLFPALGGDGILRPTLSWRLAAAAAADFEAELGYVTGGLGWQAAYNLIAPEQGDLLDLVGWVTLSNQSGQTFTGATVKLMAGDVARVAPRPVRVNRGREAVMLAMAADGAVTEKAFDEFRLYALPRPVTLRDRETKQVEFLRATGVRAPVLYVFDGAPGLYFGGGANRDPSFGSQGSGKVAVFREFRNSEENRLGVPLPKGRLRFYRQDAADGRLEFTGENELDHTPRNELVRVRTGDAFDLVGERTRTQYNGSNRQEFAEEDFEIRLRNRKTTPVTIRVVERLYRGGNWRLTQHSAPFTRRDAQTIEFEVPVAPDGETVVTYRVRYEWR